MLKGHRLTRPEGEWNVSGQLQGVPIQVFGTHPQIRSRAEEFVRPMVRRDGSPPFDALEFSLTLCEGEEDRSPGAGSKALLQFANVACFREGSWFSFHTKDGSFVKADLEGGRAWGHLSNELLEASRYIFTDLMLAPLMEMLKHRGFYGLHAAGLTKEGRGYLFPGDAGSGKTTIALSLVRQGFQYLADDKVLLRKVGNGFAALAFTRRFNINPDIGRHYTDLGFLEDLQPLPGTDKRPFDISSVYPNTFIPSCTPQVIVHLERTSDFKSRIVPLSPTESFTRLAHQTILSLQKDAAMKQINLLGDLIQNTESYLLHNGRDLYGVPERALELLPRS
jgi:hypothetical protein